MKRLINEVQAVLRVIEHFISNRNVLKLLLFCGSEMLAICLLDIWYTSQVLEHHYIVPQEATFFWHG